MSLTKVTTSMIEGTVNSKFLFSTIQNAPANVKDYGALGDSTGATPTSTGVNITSESWNVWPVWVTFANYLASAKPPTPVGHNYGDGTSGWYAANKPFSNSDTWDYIGIQRAIWAAATGTAGTNTVYLPGGAYLLSQAIRYTGPCRATLTGDGQLLSVIAYKDIATYPMMKIGVLAANQRKKVLIDFWRVGGTPIDLLNIGFSGPGGVPFQQSGVTTNTLTYDGSYVGVCIENTDSLTLTNVFITGLQEFAFMVTDYSGIKLAKVTTEYAWYAMWVGNGCSIEAASCGWYQSYPAGTRANGVWCEFTSSSLRMTDSRFAELVGTSLRWDSQALVTGCEINSGNDSYAPLQVKSNTVFTGNVIRFQSTNVASGQPGLFMENNNVVSGNSFFLGGTWGAIATNDASIATADVRKNNVITGNLFTVTSALTQPPSAPALIAGWRHYASSYVNGGDNNLVVGNSATVASLDFWGGAGNVKANNVNIT